MLVANDAVGAAPGHTRRRLASGACTSTPSRSRSSRCSHLFEQLGVPTPPLPTSFAGSEAARLAAEAATRARTLRRDGATGRVTFAPRVLRALQQADYRAKHRPPLGARDRALRALHLADPSLPGPRQPPLPAAAARHLGRRARDAATLPEIAEHVTDHRASSCRSSSGAPNKIALAYLLYRRLHGRADESLGDDGDGRYHGEVTGMVGGGMFVRFGGVFEGFVPARTLSPDERYELDDLGIAMVGTRSGHRYRLGDPIDVYVDRVDRATGRVDLRRVSAVRARREERRAAARPSARAAPRDGRGRAPAARTAGAPGASRGAVEAGAGAGGADPGHRRARCDTLRAADGRREDNSRATAARSSPRTRRLATTSTSSRSSRRGSR